MLIDISQTALSAGIDNELFEPGPEVAKEFYAEKPITLRMKVDLPPVRCIRQSGAAPLPRVVILTMHDVSLTPADSARVGSPARWQSAPSRDLGVRGAVQDVSSS